MRSGRDNGFLFATGLQAINLGADHVSEHEWGIKETRRAFGMTNEGYGIERRRVRRVPSLFVWREGTVDSYRDGKKRSETYAGLWLAKYNFSLKVGPNIDGGFYKTLWTGWSDGDLAAFSVDAEEQARIREIYDAVQRLDACIWLGGGGRRRPGSKIVWRRLAGGSSR